MLNRWTIQHFNNPNTNNMKKMKKLFVPTIIALMLYACGGNTNKQQATGNSQPSATAVTSEAKGPYKIKSGYMENKMGGFSMTQKIWFDDYGAKQYMVTLMGDKEDQYTGYSIIRDGYMYSFKNDTTAGSRMRTGISSSSMDYENMDAKDIERYGVKKTGKETLLGKECDVFEVSKYDMKVWIWKGIAFKTMMKQMTTEAVAFHEEPADPKLFEIPKDKVFKER